MYTRSNKGIHLARELEEFFANELDVYATVSNATKLRASMIVVEIDDINDKKSILRNRRMVAHRGVTIYLAQLSKAPRDIQMEIARRADEERAKGNFVKLGRFELFINNTRFHWDDEKGKLVKVEKHNTQTRNQYLFKGFSFAASAAEPRRPASGADERKLRAIPQKKQRDRLTNGSPIRQPR